MRARDRTPPSDRDIHDRAEEEKHNDLRKTALHGNQRYVDPSRAVLGPGAGLIY